MKINIKSTVDNLKQVSLEQVVFEAITNSIQAHATRIEVCFKTRNDLHDGKLIDEIIISDNGEGFNDENINSFNTYRSTHKQHLGAKGIGRFLYLKLFNKVLINSLSKEILFTIENEVEIKNSIKNCSTTTLVLSSSRKDYYVKDIEQFEKELKNHFLPLFQLLANENKVVKISLKLDETEKVINSLNLEKFNKTMFHVENYKFELDYIITSKKSEDFYSEGFYCANNRVVIKNSQLKQDSRFRVFGCVEILFILSSEYFDSCVNDERDNFDIDIKPKKNEQKDCLKSLSWVDIHAQLTKELKKLCLANGFDIEAEAKKYLQKSFEDAPYLAQYFDSENSSVLPKDKIIENAKRFYEDDKKYLRNIGNRKDGQKYEVILNKVVQTELAEYIFDREKIINRLKALTDKNTLESEIHDLFMRKGTNNDNSLDYRANNLWLFDDRFMTYNKIFSDEKINNIFPELAKNIERPDLLSIVSNTYEKESITDIVIIELKRPSNTITPAGAEEQLLKYARYIHQSNQKNKIRIWTYAFLKFTEDVEYSLMDKDYNKIPTGDTYPIYYKYNERNNIIINFMDYAALASDAYVRNKTFMSILKGCSFEDNKHEQIPLERNKKKKSSKYKTSTY